ncbi:hypothetical protein [Klebsiella pneumoniae]|uniref:hypothetical protein n=1 Tax=Klebsiella pneumoniae TaxID=573 RepID=UPI0022B7292D|nr:hypothetical protein [Klebsiella pneumoniae]
MLVKPHSASTRSSVRAELSESGKRISAAIRAHEQGMSAAMQSKPPGGDAYGRADMADQPSRWCQDCSPV